MPNSSSPVGALSHGVGLFMGRLGRERCYLVHGDQATKLPSDLLGVQAITYPSAQPLEEALIRPVDGILARIAELEAERRLAFCARFEGYWRVYGAGFRLFGSGIG